MSKKIKPFLKWAGGKGQLLDEIVKRYPPVFDTYVEPFVGGGAVMFDVLQRFPGIKRVVVNDVNEGLINVYKCLQDETSAIITRFLLEYMAIEYLSYEYGSEERKKLYLQYRDEYNHDREYLTPEARAAYFIFLNKTCFNGMYRVNSKNEFNIPHGPSKNPLICDTELLKGVTEVIKNVEFVCGDYKNTLEFIDERTFVYIDPPYRPISQTSSFNSYHLSAFGDEQQKELKEFCDEVHKRNGFFLLSNSDPHNTDVNDNFFDELYSEYEIERVQARRSINSKGNKRGNISELLINNYQFL